MRSHTATTSETMDLDTIDAIGEAINRYATTHDQSKVDLHLTPRNNFNTYTEDDHNTSAESTEDEGHDDYETPISAPDSRRASQDETRSAGHIQKAEPSTTTSNTPIIAPLEHAASLQPPKTQMYNLPAPPAYQSDDNDSSIFRHFKGPAVSPMTEPGTEQLPAYTANIELSNVFLRKSEFHTLCQRVPDRKWRRVVATLTGTKLEIHTATRPLLHHLPGHTDELFSVKKGQLLKTYSLQHAEFGLASDYLKRKHVIRVRVEAEQFLLSCTKIETLIAWMEGLQWSAGLALELDERLEVKEQTLPRSLRRRRRNRRVELPVSGAGAEQAELAELGADDVEEDSGAAGEDRLRGGVQRPTISRSPSPTVEEETAPDPEPVSNHGGLVNNHLFTTSAYSSIVSTPSVSRTNTVRRPPVCDESAAPAASNHGRSTSNIGIAFRPSRLPEPTSARPHTSNGTRNGRDGLARYPSALSQSINNLSVPQPTSAFASATSSTANTPSSSTLNLSRRAKRKAFKSSSLSLPTSSPPHQVEKQTWNPAVRWSATYDLAYAKKCMPVMHRDSKRKGVFVVVGGVRFLVCEGGLGDKGKGGRGLPVMVRWEEGGRLPGYSR